MLWLDCVYLSHLSMTCLSRPWVHPSCPEVLVSSESNKKTFLYSPCFILSFLFPFLSHSLHILLLSRSLRPSLSVPLPLIKRSLYCLYKGIGVVNRCRVMGYLYWQASAERVVPLLFPALTLTPAILFWWIAPTIHLNYVTGNELSVQSGPNEAQGLFLLTLPQHSLLLLITVRVCRSDAARSGLWLAFHSAAQCLCVALFSLPLYSCWEAAVRKMALYSSTTDYCYINPSV